MGRVRGDPYTVGSNTLSQLFPFPVAAKEYRGDRAEARLLPEEAACVARAMAKRRSEFAAGRHCARAAMAELGFAPAAVVVGPDREPVWPDGLVGCITHTDEFVGAVVAPSRLVAGIGVDVEMRGRVEPRLWRMVFNDPEVAWLETLEGEHRSDMATVLFSAKEAFYKCQHGLTRVWLGFHDATVTIEDDRFRLELLVERPALEGHAPFDGRFRVDERFVAAGIAIRGR